MIRLMTYNICAGTGMDNVKNIERAIEVIRKSDAQIVCLQEVDQGTKRSHLIDQPAEMGKALGMKYAFQGNLKMDSGWYGIAILSRFDIAEQKCHSLTSVDEPRGILETKIDTPEGHLAVFCTHFGLEDKERETQAAEVSAIINAVGGTRVVCGDFNEETNAKGVSSLIESASLIDSDPNGNLTFDSKNPSIRIDLILHSPNIKIESIGVVETTASDHKPLVADISIVN